MMSPVKFFVIFCLSFHYTYSSINTADSEAYVENLAEVQGNPAYPNVDDEVLALDISNLGTEMFESRRCVPAECNAHCRRLGHARAVCIGTYCQCRMRSLPLEIKEEVPVEDVVETAYEPLLPTDVRTLEAEEEIETKASSRCTILACAQLCLRLGFRYSSCSNGWCICWR